MTLDLAFLKSKNTALTIDNSEAKKKPLEAICSINGAIICWAVSESRSDKRTGVVSPPQPRTAYWENEYAKIMGKWR